MLRKNPLLVPELRGMLAVGDTEALRDFCETFHPAVAAELISALSADEAWAVLGHAEPGRRAEIFSHVDDDIQADIIEILPRQDIARLMTEMPPDDRADLYRRLPETSREAIMPAIAQAEREDIRRLASYEEGTAGSVMTSDYATLSPHLTAAQAIERLREVAPDRETIYYAYVVDGCRKLLGFVSLKDLIVARRDALVSDFMDREPVFTRVDTDQEQAALIIQKYDLIALPVINGGDALVGIITHDDALDIITQEQTEDMEKFMAIAGSHGEAAYLRTPPWIHFRNRAPWIVALALLGLVSGFIVQSSRELLMQFAILTAFMPMVAATGGNTGSQSATLVIRALALREVTPRDILRIVAKEFQIAILLAVLLAAVAFGRVLVTGGGTAIPSGISISTIGIAISVALGLHVVTSTLLGAVLPLVAAGLKLDPAVIASPALASAVDVTGLLIYFTTARLLLGI